MQNNSYEVLYNKYRPKVFNDLIGQDSAIKILNNQIKFDKISHAYIFSGPRGTGKTSVARIFAAAINCQSENKPCYKCRNCQEIQYTSDIIELDAASNNKVGDIEEILKYVEYPPISNKYKVFIIDEAHMLTTQALNSLLKIMEEPPEYAIFILATTEVNKIIDTIRSRCLSIDFRLIPKNLISNKIGEILKKEKISFTKEAIELVAEEANGSMRDSLSLLESIIAFKVNDIRNLDYTVQESDVSEILGIVSQKEIIDLLNDLNKFDLSKAIDKLHLFFNKTNNVMSLYRGFVNTIIKLIYLKSSKDLSNQNKELKEIIENFNVQILLNLLNKLGLVETRLLSTSQPYTIFEMTLLSSVTFADQDSYNDNNLARIERLENELTELKTKGITVKNQIVEKVVEKEEKINEELEVKIPPSLNSNFEKINPVVSINDETEAVMSLFALGKVDRLIYVNRAQALARNMITKLINTIDNDSRFIDIKPYILSIDKYSGIFFDGIIYLYVLKNQAYQVLDKPNIKKRLLEIFQKYYQDVNQIKFIDSDMEQKYINIMGSLERVLPKDKIKIEKD